ncbi:MAG: hypothetical protein EHM41_21655 [Chloroflexi bacterium]|nr:MAG: hypothetical protein EHM41_21655 [Chloroflexota bacterium]
MSQERKILRKRQSLRRSKRRKQSADDSTNELITPQIQRLIEKHQGKNILATLPNPSLQMAFLDHIQKTAGNTAAQRYLSGRTVGTANPYRDRQEQKGMIQRQKPSGEKGGEAEAAGEKAAPFNFDQWLSGKVYEIVKEQLGEDILRGYAKDLAKKAGSLLLEQVNEVNSEADFIQKAQNKLLSEVFSSEVTKAVNEILKSPAGMKVKELILKQANQEPASVIGMILTALAFMAANNADIPTIELEKKFGKGFSVQAKADLGKFQEIALKQVKLGIGYSSQKFQTSLSGVYREKPLAKLSMRDEALQTQEEIKFKTDPNLSSSGEISFDFNVKSHGLKTTALFGGPNKWMGVWEFRLGEKNYYWSPKIVLGPDQKLSFSLGHQFISDSISIYSAIKPTGGQVSMGHYLKLDKPFGAEGLSVEASLDYRMDEPKLNLARLSGQYKLLEGKPTSLIPVVVLKVEGKYQAAGPTMPKPEFAGYIVVWGSW